MRKRPKPYQPPAPVDLTPEDITALRNLLGRNTAAGFEPAPDIRGAVCDLTKERNALMRQVDDLESANERANDLESERDQLAETVERLSGLLEACGVPACALDMASVAVCPERTIELFLKH